MCMFSLVVSLPILCDDLRYHEKGYRVTPTVSRFLPSRLVCRFQLSYASPRGPLHILFLPIS